MPGIYLTPSLLWCVDSAHVEMQHLRRGVELDDRRSEAAQERAASAWLEEGGRVEHMGMHVKTCWNPTSY